MELTAKQLSERFTNAGISISIVEASGIIRVGKAQGAIYESGRIPKEKGERGRKTVLYSIPDSFTIAMPVILQEAKQQESGKAEIQAKPQKAKPEKGIEIVETKPDMPIVEKAMAEATEPVKRTMKFIINGVERKTPKTGLKKAQEEIKAQVKKGTPKAVKKPTVKKPEGKQLAA